MPQKCNHKCKIRSPLTELCEWAFWLAKVSAVACLAELRHEFPDRLLRRQYGINKMDEEQRVLYACVHRKGPAATGPIRKKVTNANRVMPRLAMPRPILLLRVVAFYVR